MEWINTTKGDQSMLDRVTNLQPKASWGTHLSNGSAVAAPRSRSEQISEKWVISIWWTLVAVAAVLFVMASGLGFSLMLELLVDGDTAATESLQRSDVLLFLGLYAGSFAACTLAFVINEEYGNPRHGALTVHELQDAPADHEEELSSFTVTCGVLTAPKSL